MKKTQQKQVAEYYRTWEPYGYRIDKINNKAYSFNRYYTYLGQPKSVWATIPEAPTERYFLYNDDSNPWINEKLYNRYVKLKDRFEFFSGYKIVDVVKDDGEFKEVILNRDLFKKK